MAGLPGKALPIQDHREEDCSRDGENRRFWGAVNESDDRDKVEGIASWPAADRPRERLLQLGPHALTDSELVAILLSAGYRGTNAVELSRQIIARFGSLRALLEAPLQALQEIKGLGGAKIARLAAALETGRRAALPDGRETIIFRRADAVVSYLTIRLRGLHHEHFRGLYLNRQGVLLHDMLLATGTVDQARPSVRDIVAKAFQANASALILAHNHPSGAAEASDSDRMFTADVLSALRPIGISLLDHVIVAGDSAFSFANAGLMAELNLACLAPDRRLRDRGTK